ncbi:rnhA operon protein [Halobacteria archaeon AArc-m2/3/4]|uniref:RnhA operon protein n=1 Tax=Natronoglomus mannanivorans TaxID=2979990 RepID=A0ABT2QDV7_9EURY|nr:rnhA operon protein [Halobacteria archaeon AArc-m2/3/4]
MSDLNPADASDGTEDGDGVETETDELPEGTIEEAERLTRLARQAIVDREEASYRDRRSTILEDHDFTARVREESTGDVLVLHPEEWHDSDEGVIRTDRIDDVSRAIEVRLEGAGDPDDWEAVDADNRSLVETIRAEHGDAHGDNADAFADFMGNHYARRMDSATTSEIAEFLEEYYVRNVWSSEEQRAVIEESIGLVFETAGEPVPEFVVQ